MNKESIRLAIVYANKLKELYMELHDKTPAEPERFFAQGAISAYQNMTAFLNALMVAMGEEEK